MSQSTVHLIGSASGIAASNPGCWEAPFVLKKSEYFKQSLINEGIEHVWEAILQPNTNNPSVLKTVSDHCKNLALEVKKQVENNVFFTVIGGDHSCAIGTWSGVADAVKNKGDIGLIWVDAHLDSHTPDTSETGNIHGMPLASLLGYGDELLTKILNDSPKLKPENICIIAARSYEKGEIELLKRLNAKIFYMDDIKQRGLATIMSEAIDHVNKKTIAYGISIDVDSIDPTEAPGTGVPEPDGISTTDLTKSLHQIAEDKRLIGTEIVEFNPSLDHQQKTEKIVTQILISLIKK